MKFGIFGLALLLVASAGVYAAISANAVESRTGVAVTVCGNVASARKDTQLRGDPVFLTLGHAYADQDFTVVVLGERRGRFGAPEALIGHRLCVSGHMRSFLGKPRMLVGSATE